MMSTGTVIIVTCTETDTGPVTMEIGGIEAGALTGEGKKAVGTGQIMTEEGRRLATEVMNEAGNGRGKDIGIVIAEDRHLQRGPTKKITKEPGADPPAERERDLDGRRRERGGQRIRVPVKRRVILLLKTKSQRRSFQKKMKRKMKNCSSLCGFVVPIQKATIQMTLWIKWGTPRWLEQVGSEICMKGLRRS